MAMMFPTILRPASYTVGQELALGLGPTSTLVFMTSTGNFTFTSIAATGGNIDGMVVCLCNISNTLNRVHTFSHESGSASAAANRLWNPGLASLSTGTGIGAVTYRYDATLLRWIMMSHT